MQGGGLLRVAEVTPLGFSPYLFHSPVLIRWVPGARRGESRGAAGLLVQMSGAPGSGKSTIAAAIVSHYRAVAVDHDVIKSALLAAGCQFEEAGAASYGVLLAVVEELLGQGQQVVVDSPCYYQELLVAGQELAGRFGLRYRYVECVTADLAVLDQRLRARVPLRSQRPSVDTPPVDLPADPGSTGAALFEEWIAHMKRPAGGYLRLDTTKPLDECVRRLRAFLDADDPEADRGLAERRRR
jgi:predicted kinase